MAEWRIARRHGECNTPDCEHSFADGERHVSTLSVAGGQLLRLDFCTRCWSEERAQAAIERMREERALAMAQAEGCTSEAGIADQAPDGLPAQATGRAAKQTPGFDPAAASEATAARAAGSAAVSRKAAARTEDEDEDPAGLDREDLFWWFTRHVEGKKRSLQLDMESLERLFLQLEGRPEPRLRELRYVICLLLMRKRRLKVVKVERGTEGESFIVRRPRREESLRVFVFDFDASRMEELRHDLQAIFDGAEEEGELRLPDADAVDSAPELDEPLEDGGPTTASPDAGSDCGDDEDLDADPPTHDASLATDDSTPELGGDDTSQQEAGESAPASGRGRGRRGRRASRAGS